MSIGIESIHESNKVRFINDAKHRFGNKYDYSHVIYQRQKLPVQIICPIHGSFYQTPDMHLRATHGCPQCSREAQAKKRKLAGYERFISKFNKKHSAKIELLSSYLGIKEIIKCRCRVHNLSFETYPHSLNLYEYVCPLCAKEKVARSKSIGEEEFYARIKKQFGSSLDFSETVYSGPNIKVSVKCPEHGLFSVLPKTLLSRTHGCLTCSSRKKGYASWRLQHLENLPSKSGTSHIGVMRVNVHGISSYKLGTSKRKLQHRYKEYLQEIFFDAILDEIDALRLELMLHSKYSDMRDERIFKAGMRTGKRWSGDSELYFKKAVPLIIEDLKRYVTELEHKNPNYWDDKPLVMPPELKIQSVRREKGVWNIPRPVICLNNMKTYVSAAAAAKELEISQGNISTVCLGKRGNAGGFKFAYVDDYENNKVPKFINRQKGGDNPRARTVLCIETGEVFPTSIAAGQSKNVSPSHITSVCRGNRKSAGGFSWSYF